MPKFSKTIVTNLGLQTIQEAYASGGHFKFSEASTTTDDMTGLAVSDLKKITSLTNEPQTVPVESSYAANGKVNVNVAFDNKDLKEDYYLTALALYIEDDAGNKVLYSITLPTEGKILISAGDGNSSAGLDITFNTAISDDGTVLIGISDVGMATHTDLKRLADDIAKQTDDKIAKISVGGRNFVLNGDLMMNMYKWRNWDDAKPAPDPETVEREIVDIIDLPGFNRAFRIKKKEKSSQRIGLAQDFVTVRNGDFNTYSLYVKAEAGTEFDIEWGNGDSEPWNSIRCTSQDNEWHRYSVTFLTKLVTKYTSVYIGIAGVGEIYATGFQNEDGIHMSDFSNAQEDIQAGTRNYWNEDNAEIGYYDTDGSINTSTVGSEFDLHTPLMEIPTLYGYLTISTFDNYDAYKHTTVAFYDKENQIIGSTYGTKNPLPFTGDNMKRSVTLPIPSKARKFGVSFWKVTGKHVMIELGNVAHDYVPSVERLFDEINTKQDLIVQPGTYAYATCPDGTDFGEFLKSDKVPYGFSYIRNNNKGYIYNYAVLKENKLWVFAKALNAGGNESIYTISNGKSSGYLNMTADENDFSKLANTNGTFPISLFKEDNKSLTDVIVELVDKKRGPFMFYCQAGVADNPAGDQSLRGISISATDTIAPILAVDNSNRVYVGVRFDGSNKINWNRVATDGSVSYLQNIGITDMNNLNTTGKYAISTVNIANTPIEAMAWVFVEVVVTGSMIMQKVYYDTHSSNDKSGVYIRHKGGSPATWAPWRFIKYS